ncbi:Kv channel-interacting protein 4-like isoform X1 [Topomyia yanbarensis]|uniref:Kv channel-interacting protein 4-like isoform X1 n=1 Tax=Topomyia yanbarensis TaxID=2498891 RepID=UPI00273B11AD|nr:Kv channel-interacting protein 4-like isoform X1 [Topomyia yanbarensis]XP_058821797.1 Kv channel-interacting protein 4-like isoform X1 [Topomyia yanbarensis]XP_058821798.1 Kv channel-interacting protein 4-like isoform X1 [Topomyia yanbarensis]
MLAVPDARSDLAGCSREPMPVIIKHQVRRNPYGFTAIEVESGPVSNTNGTNNGGRGGCRQRRAGAPGNSRQNPSQSENSSCLRDCLLCKCCNKSGTEETTQASDGEESEEFENCELEEIVTLPKYRPESIAALCEATRFTEAEIKRIYRGFKAECPAGIIREETFKFIYSQFFPQGANTSLYAHYVFNTLDKDHTGILSFENFVQGLSILSRGSLEEKLSWTFSLYDINHDGKITREEMTDIVIAIYELMGAREDGGTDDAQIKSKVEKVFLKMDTNRDGVITIEEFLDCCRKDKLISDSMGVFDSTI